MKYFFCSLFLFCCLLNAQTSWDDKDELTFYNDKGVELQKKEFRKYAKDNRHLIRGLDERKNDMHLVEREEHGQISNRKALDSILSVSTGKSIKSNDPLVIIFYPGPDPCNQTGTKDKVKIRAWWKGLNKRLNDLAGVSTINIKKTNLGLGKYDGIVDWYFDPVNTVERLFFEYHYPCLSFTVVSPSGKYISVFGEFGPNAVLTAVQLIQARSFDGFSHKVSVPSDWKKFDWHGAKCYTPKAVYKEDGLRFDNNIFINEWNSEVPISKTFNKEVANFRKTFNTSDIKTKIESGKYGKTYILEGSYSTIATKKKVRIIYFKFQKKEVRIEIRFREDLYDEYIEQCNTLIESISFE